MGRDGREYRALHVITKLEQFVIPELEEIMENYDKFSHNDPYFTGYAEGLDKAITKVKELLLNDGFTKQ